VVWAGAMIPANSPNNANRMMRIGFSIIAQRVPKFTKMTIRAGKSACFILTFVCGDERRLMTAVPATSYPVSREMRDYMRRQSHKNNESLSRLEA
jgi:hypothetical protein